MNLHNSTISPKPCSYCGKTNHNSLQCFDKPRVPLKKKKLETYEKELETKHGWFKANPGPSYECYLQISELCPKLLTRDTVIQEHMIPKSRGEKYKYDIKNIRPACEFCNFIKGSRTLENLAKDYPSLTRLVGHEV